jgi:large subunit ribosomal protein L15
VLKLNDIQPGQGARKTKHRVGRGAGSGSGCTASFGFNGSAARSGDHFKAYFEGGQTPLSRRIPKRGFTNFCEAKFQTVNIGDISKKVTGAKDIDAAWLHENKLIRSKTLPVKVLGDGDLTQALVIKANAFSASAKEKIEKAKGKAEEIARA